MKEFFNARFSEFLALVSEESLMAWENLIFGAILIVVMFYARAAAKAWGENKRARQKERKNDKKYDLEKLESLECWCGKLDLWIEKFADGFDARIDRDVGKSMSEIKKCVEVYFPEKLREEMVALDRAYAHCRLCWDRVVSTKFDFSRFYWNEELEGFEDEGFFPAREDLRDANTAFCRAVAELKRKL
ncbi:MAG: hypothetical protein MPJ22_05890 [Pirellulales bacterium]|nr:hypothetical protein [Pirellulales bacterium]